MFKLVISKPNSKNIINKIDNKYKTQKNLRKEKILLTHGRSSKQDAGQERRIGTTESSDVSKVKVPKLSKGKRITNLVRDGGGGAFSNADHILALGEEMRNGKKN